MYDNFLSDILEDVDRKNTNKVGDENEEEKLLSSFFLVDVQIQTLRFALQQYFFIAVAF